ncbi:hypothetical protein JOC77_004202 [Peribacillus deserti]|uniref:Uncharacterized protein n=1 Tax=Peribacillus deserti TaxID=673318 RepID=A0ABS2QNX6_9BACI|nr:hypothetical protein [Peribacillus deserti]MBM7694725.1 hypothetical protein [Peribacillus deserti]
MLIRILQIVSGFLSGYLFMEWIHIPEPFIFAEFISTIILEPHYFFAAAAAFLACFLIHAVLLRDAVSPILKRKEKINKLDFFLCCQAATSFAALFMINKALAVLLFSFAGIYGMISIDFSEKGKNKQSGS